MSKRWLLNADVGEGYDDNLIMPYINCANICCGAHAGGMTEMRQTLCLAKKYDVIPGAHPGYADRENFGRLSLDLADDVLHTTLEDQISELKMLADELALPLRYVKPHGAMNHDMLQKDMIFTAICAVTAEIDGNLAVMVPINQRHKIQQKIADKYALTIWWEVYADRLYEPNGLLRPRKYPDAVHHEAQKIVDQIDSITRNGKIIALDGSELDVAYANSICVHGDNPTSAKAVKQWIALQQ